MSAGEQVAAEGATPPPGASAMAVVREIYAAFAARDVGAVFARFAPEVEIVQSRELPWGGTFRGHAEARQFFGRLTGAINSTVTIERWLHAGERVIAIGWTRGTVNATGAPYDVPLAHVWEVRAGQVTRVEFHIDNPTMLEALRRA